MKRLLRVHSKLLLVVAGLLLAVSSARADVIYLTVYDQFRNASPGDVLYFGGDVWADGANEGWMFLNGDTALVDWPLIMDDTPFFAYFPPALEPGDGWYDDLLFTVTVPMDAPDGFYTGSFEIDGGSDQQTYDPLASADFNIQIGESTGAPEPWSFVLAGTALLALGSLRTKGGSHAQR